MTITYNGRMKNEKAKALERPPLFQGSPAPQDTLGEKPVVYPVGLGWAKARQQGYECTWEILLTPRAYRAYKRGDDVFCPMHGTANPVYEQDVRQVSFEWNDDYA